LLCHPIRVASCVTPVTHRSNINAWITSTLFQQWIESFNASLLKKGKNVCLLLDNCSAHKIEDSALKCIELAYLPPNTTSSVQPLDQGIIKNFKHHYRRQMLQKIVLTTDSNENITATEVARSLSVLSAVNFMSASWTDVSKETFQTCFFSPNKNEKLMPWLRFTEQISQKVLAEHQKKQEIMAAIYSGRRNRK